jgi:hypothetical protein
LQWQFAIASPQLPTIGPYHTCDLGHVEGDSGFSLAVYVMPHNFQGAIRRNERMRVEIRALADNGESKPLLLEIAWDGQWSDDTVEMRRHLTVKRVTSIDVWTKLTDEGKELTDSCRSVDGLHVGFRFQRRIKILPGLAINISKSGVGFSAGGRGFHAGIDSKGRRYTSASLPGTGISWRQYQKAKPHHSLPPHVEPRIAPPDGGHQLSPHGEASRVARNVALAIAIGILLVTLVAIVSHLHWNLVDADFAAGACQVDVASTCTLSLLHDIRNSALGLKTPQ